MSRCESRNAPAPEGGPMAFDQVVEALELNAEAAREWREGWAESQVLFGREGGAFLSQSFVADTCARLGMTPAVAAAFQETLPVLEQNETLKGFVWHGYCRLFRDNETVPVPPRTWPMVPERLGAAGRMLYGFLCLSGVPYLEARYRALGIDLAVMVETLSDIEVWMHHHRRERGAWGFILPQWLMNHFRLRLFRLGRLQFEMRTFPLDVHAYRNRDTREVVIFAGDGARFRRDGQFDGTNNIRDPHAWRATFCADASVVAGFPIEDGGACQRELRLPTDAWEPILAIDDPCLNVHIAAEAPLDHDACTASYHRALGFFGAHFPEHRFKAFYCDSWLLDYQLAEYLPESSNILRFQRDWRLLPIPHASDAQTIERVFGGNVSDPTTQEASTSLQRQTIAHMKKGKRWRNAGGILFPQEFEADGACPVDSV